jgi:immune inhibitor A
MTSRHRSSHGGTTCLMPPHPELIDRWKAEVRRIRERRDSPVADVVGLMRKPRRLGFDDGVIIPPEEFRTRIEAIRSAAAARVASVRRTRRRPRTAGKLMEIGRL